MQTSPRPVDSEEFKEYGDFMKTVGTLVVVGLISSAMGGEVVASEPNHPIGQAPYDAPAASRLSRILVTRARLLTVSADSSVPVLWKTRLIDENGTPIAGAELVAYADPRTPASDIAPPLGSEVSGVEPQAVAWGMSDDNGDVVVRLQPSQVADFADESGWVTLTYAIGGNLGAPRLYFDSVFARSRAGLVTDLESGDGTPGLDWMSSDVGYVDAADSRPTVADLAPAILAKAETEEQPLTITVDVPVASASDNNAGNGLRRRVQPPTPPTDCTVTRTDELGIQYLPLTRMYLNQLWSSTFDYYDTSTTSVDVAVSVFGSAGTFGASTNLGSVNISRNTTNLRVLYGAAAPSGTTVAVELAAPYQFQGQWWHCRLQAITYRDSYVVYPTNPRPELLGIPDPKRKEIRAPRILRVTLPTCTNTPKAVLSGKAYSRTNGSAGSSHSAPLSFSAGVSASPFGIPVSGGVSITPSTTLTYASGATQFWTNVATTTRSLCGVNSQNLSGSTDIVALK